MTCVVGVVDRGVVWIGADSAAVSEYSLTVRADEKVFVRGPFIMGFTTSFRMGQLLRYRLEVPGQAAGQDAHEFMATVFIDAVRECLKGGGWAKEENKRESGGNFLVGYKGRLFEVETDYQVGESADEMGATGCGYQIALGALYASRGKPARTRVELALEAAERWSAGVRRPFVIKKLKPSGHVG